MDKSSGSSDITPGGCGRPNLGTTLPITLNITTTTGGSFSVLVDLFQSVENLKKIIGKKLKVAKDRICLLHRERELQDGTLKDNGVMDGSKIILIPSVETGLLAQRPENTVMQALESLNDSQVNNFLSGKTPLNLSMRLGDHMMLIQLQLSTVNPSSPSHSNSKPRSSQSSSRTSTSTCAGQQTTSNCHSYTKSEKIVIEKHDRYHTSSDKDSSTCERIVDAQNGSSLSSESPNEMNSFLTKQDFDSLQSIVKSLSFAPQSNSDTNSSDDSMNQGCCSDSINTDSLLEQSPIKSLSNLVSSPIKTTSIKNIPTTTNFHIGRINSINKHSNSPDPISAKLTSCLCKRLENDSCNCELNQCPSREESLSSNNHFDRNATTGIMRSRQSQHINKTANNPITKSKHRHQYHANNIFCKSTNNDKRRMQDESDTPFSATFVDNASSDIVSDGEESLSTISGSDNRALAEASRSLTQTLRKLSKEVFTNKVDLAEEIPRKTGSGAVIESMKNHGKGIYSGTFSGTLNPALQDRYGRPKRDISTVIHILNDLLSATPQYNRGAIISFEQATRNVKQTSTRARSSDCDSSCIKCANSSKVVTCVYGECNGHYNNTLNSTTFDTYCVSCRRHGEYNSTYCKFQNTTSTDNSSEALSSSLSTFNTTNDNSSCTCDLRNEEYTKDVRPSNAEKIVCSKCTVEIENNKTKYKLDQLRLVMQERKQKREARKMKGAPYGARVLSTPSNTSVTPNPSNKATNTISAPLASPSEVSPKHIAEEVDTAA